jgi:hypothetical protein
MGGFFSTRWNFTSTKLLTHSVAQIDARRYWQLRCQVPKQVYLAPVAAGLQPITLTWTPCHYGGERPWWQCPGCHRRCGILYLRRVWVCRLCAGLAYWSTRVSKPSRLDDRARRLERKIGIRWNADHTRWQAVKPKRMHQRTFARLLAQWQDLRMAEDMAREDELLRGLARSMRVADRLEAKVAKWEQKTHERAV